MSTSEKDTSASSNDEVVHICATVGCEKPATLACPSCLKLGLPPTRFCDQECFKANWSVHKDVHKAAKKDQLPAAFKNFRFSGKLRPAKLSEKRVVPDHIPRPDYADHPTGIPAGEVADKRSNTSIRVYTPTEIDGIREACRIGRKVLDAGAAILAAGVTCDEVDRVIHETAIANDSYPSPLNYHQFPKSVCTSVNEVICHGIPDMRVLEEGDIVNLDVTVYYKGYHGDLNETFMIGKQSADSAKLVETAYATLTAAVAMCKPGTLYRDLGHTIQHIARAAKCQVTTSYCGHGIGELFHTSPNVPHYAGNKAKGVMAVGHVFTIEPMINLGTYEDRLWPDNWTAVTADGKRSAQFEHTMVVTANGVELLTGRVGEPADHMVWNAQTWQK